MKLTPEQISYRNSLFPGTSKTQLLSRSLFFGYLSLFGYFKTKSDVKLFKRLLLTLGSLLFLFVVSLIATPVDPLLVFMDAGYEEPSLIFAKDKDGNDIPIAEFYQFSRRVIHVKDLGEDAKIIRSFIATEDNNFYYHPGIDIQGILRAMVVNIMAGRVKEGASTITQQVARLRFLSNERNIFRKGREALLSLFLEGKYTISELSFHASKNKIMEIYLNEVPLGHGAFGVEAAASFFFEKNVKDLSWGEAAILASLTTRPRDFSPIAYPYESRQKVKVVFRKLVENGELSVEDAQKEFRTLEQDYYFTLNRSPNDTAFNRRLNLFPYASEYVKSQLPRRFRSRLNTGGLRIYTTIQFEHQQAADETFLPYLRNLTEQRKRPPFKNFYAFDEEFGSVLPLLNDLFDIQPYERVIGRQALKFQREFVAELRDESSLLNLVGGESNVIAAIEAHEQDDTRIEEQMPVEGGLISMRPDGAITSVAGGSGFTSANQQLRFLTARRQPGSSFKPILYAAGIEDSANHAGEPDKYILTPSSILEDGPLQFVGTDLTEYSPENYSGDFQGDIRLRKALTLSRNAVAVQAFMKVGPDRILPLCRKIMGWDRLSTPKRLPREAATALGTFSITPLEMAKSFSTFANGGYSVDPYVLVRITDSSGSELWSADDDHPKVRVISETTAEIITSMLRDVVQSGTGTGARLPGRDAVGKTGTTNRNTDAWFVGYTPNLVTAVHIGYDYSRSLGGHGTGGTIAAPAWGRFMHRALRGEKSGKFEFPDSKAQAVTICESTGKLPGPNCSETLTELFHPGTAPTNQGDDDGSSRQPEAIKGLPNGPKKEDVFSEGDL